MSSQEQNTQPENHIDNFAEARSALSNNADLDTFKRLIESFPVNLAVLDNQSNQSNTLLHFSVTLNRYEIFTYLLSLNCYDEEIICDVLRHCLHQKLEEKYAIDMINKCKNLDYLDLIGNNLLHYSMAKHSIRLSQILIERGMDINTQNINGATPLHMLLSNRIDRGVVSKGVELMLYYEADVSICDNYGNVPFDLAVIYHPSLVATHEILFNYTVDKHSEYKITTDVLFELLKSESPLFFKIVNFVSDVKITESVFPTPALFFTISPKFLQVMIDKFSSVISEVFLIKPLDSWYYILSTPPQNWEMLLNSCVASDIIEFIGRQTIDSLLHQLVENLVHPGSLHCFIFYLLTYGLKVWAKDLHTVYRFYGYCHLFKFLLHMDIQESACDIVPRVIYDIHLDLDNILDDPDNFCVVAFEPLLSYFARPKLENHLHEMETFYHRTLPKVPLLVELARDETRKYLVKKFQLKTSRQFYLLLNKLNISVYDKKVLSFEKKLYTR